MTWRPDNRLALENDLPRADIEEKITGRAKYTTDIYPPHLLWAGFIRCPYGHAELLDANLDEAKSVPGVLEVEVRSRKGTYPGDRLGHLCAESREAYEAGMAALGLQFDIRTPRTRLEREKSPLEAHDPGGDGAAVEAALRDAAAVIEATYGTEVQTHCCLEPHVAVVDYRGDQALAWGSTQGTFSCRDDIKDELGLPAAKVEFHCEHIGGGFGSKFGAGAEGQLAARMSKKYRRPCRVCLSRWEEHLDSGMRPGSLQYMKVGADAEGRIVGARVHTWGSVGPTGGGGGVKNPARYRFGKTAKTHEDVHLHSGHPRPMRAPGHPQGAFALELMMDELAAALGMDPLEVRRRNESNDVRKKMYDVGAQWIGWNRRLPNGSGSGPVRRGFGLGVGEWGNSSGDATIEIQVYRDGSVVVLSGCQDIGTGFRTVMRDSVAHQLGIPGAQIEVRVGVSTYPPGPASGGSVTSRFTAPKALHAAEKVKRKLLAMAATEWGGKPAEYEIRDGKVHGPGVRKEWVVLCSLMAQDRLVESADDNDGFWGKSTDSEAVQFAEVEVDTETGGIRVVKVVALQEVGTPVNRLACENQIIGAVIQGMSYALFENRILNERTGAMVNPDFGFYKIAGPLDIPEIIPVIWRERDDAPVNSLGEPPVIPTAGAIACAVFNAIGKPVRHLPMTPDRVLEAWEEA